MNGRVLLVEDEELVGTMVQMNLAGAGYEVHWSKSGLDGLACAGRAGRDGWDAILLDIGLPGLGGLEVLERLRRDGLGTPIMMLTARGDVPTKVQALEIGADDYLPKPFDVAELLARVHALVRRAQADRQIPSTQLITIGRFAVNLDTRAAETNEGPLVLNDKEAALLALLVRVRGKVLKRSDILDEVWGMDASPTERTVDNFILRLRKWFEPEPTHPRHIVTVRGLGYRFVP